MSKHVPQVQLFVGVQSLSKAVAQGSDFVLQILPQIPVLTLQLCQLLFPLLDLCGIHTLRNYEMLLPGLVEMAR
jgi:hypothetical protein